MSMGDHVRAVLSAFAGVRSGQASAKAKLKSGAIVLTGIVLALLLALGVWVLVQLVVATN
ncbi:DUF2970 domain-containing protein [Chitinibacteraceae bacterium HSL-7]